MCYNVRWYDCHDWDDPHYSRCQNSANSGDPMNNFIFNRSQVCADSERHWLKAVTSGYCSWWFCSFRVGFLGTFNSLSERKTKTKQTNKTKNCKSPVRSHFNSLNKNKNKKTSVNTKCNFQAQANNVTVPLQYCTCTNVPLNSSSSSSSNRSSSVFLY